MKRWIAVLCLVAIALCGWWVAGYLRPAPALPSLTPEALAALQPEICEGSTFIQTLTAITPWLNPGSPNTRQNAEQIALVDQYKPSGRRKLWVLRLPGAFINQRTCDVGRTNWIGTGDDVRVSQSYGIGLVLLPDRTIPVTLASKDEFAAGLGVEMHLENRVSEPDRIHRAYARTGNTHGWKNELPPCREEETDFGLVRFRRPDPDPEPAGTRCGGRTRDDKWDTKMYAKKIGDMEYDFLAHCIINCTAETDYNGWRIKIAFPHKEIARWSLIHQRIREILDKYTVHIEREGT